MSADDALFAAIRERDAAEVARLLREGTDPNRRQVRRTRPRLATRDPGGKPYPGDTPLLVAVQYEAVSIVTLLLAHGAEVNGRSQDGKTALMEATRADTVELLRLLLDRGAKPDLADERGGTALVQASGYLDRARHIDLLLKAGADPNGASGETPLQAAAEIGDVANIRLLLRHGAKVNLTRTNPNRPLKIAVEDKNDEAAALLRKAGGTVGPKVSESRSSYAAPSERPIPPRDRTLSDDDRRVLNALLADLLAYQGEDLVFLPKGGTRLLVCDTTRGGYSDDQLNADLNDEQAVAVTLAMREHLAARNGASVSLAGLKPTHPGVLVRSRSQIKAVSGRFGQVPADIRMVVVLSLPGYSPRRDRAVVHFSFGPTPHGASGTYFLQRTATGWKILWRAFSYYA